MKLQIEPDDLKAIAKEVADLLGPLLSGQNNKERDNIFDVSGLADYLTVSPKWVYDHVHELPHFKLGGFLRFN